MSMKFANELLGRFNLREALIAPHALDRALLLPFFHTIKEADDSLEDEACRVSGPTRLLAAYGFSPQTEQKPFAFKDGLAIIPVHGTTVNRMSYSWGSATGYNFIRNTMNAALADPDVKGIVLDMNSNGGEAAGCFELAAEIRQARDQKPILAIVDSAAYSAGYAIASAATKVVAAPSAGVGSVGVVVMHVSLEGLLDKNGVAVTYIHAGAHKVDGNPFQNLSDGVKKRIQTSIDKTYTKFVALVAENRGMDAKDVQATEALTYNADDALEIGFIDAIATPQAAIASFLTELPGSKTQLKGKTMEKENESGQALSAADLNKAAQAARVAERQRMAGITGCDEAKDKPKLANHLAMNTEMSVEDAKAVLSAAGPEVTSAETTEGKNALTEAMGKEGGAGVRADAVVTTEKDKELSGSAKILAAQGKAHGSTAAK